ncbi:MAG: hypothetical protein IRZ03_14470 [Acidobacterium ailaaui]|nr:hypothetical protein [Pseudacidobacterium ailaaui]
MLLSLLLLSCSKQHLVVPQRLSYDIRGYGAFAVIHSNELHRDLYFSIDSSFSWSEWARPGDTIDVLVMAYLGHPAVMRIKLDQTLIAIGQTGDTTGILTMKGVLKPENFYK